MQRGTGDLFSVGNGDDLGPADKHASAGDQYLATRPELLAQRGREEVDLILNSQHLVARWGEGEGGVAASVVCDRAGNGTVEVALCWVNSFGRVTLSCQTPRPTSTIRAPRSLMSHCRAKLACTRSSVSAASKRFWLTCVFAH